MLQIKKKFKAYKVYLNDFPEDSTSSSLTPTNAEIPQEQEHRQLEPTLLLEKILANNDSTSSDASAYSSNASASSSASSASSLLAKKRKKRKFIKKAVLVSL
jgi:hypothetical protein